MKRSRRAHLPFALLLAIAACGKGDGGGASADATVAQDGASARLAETSIGEAGSGALGGYSLFHLESDWWDQHGSVGKLDSLAGRAQVLAMTYSFCGHSCPLLIADMKRIEASLDPDLADRVGFVLVSLDPQRDTPARLTEYAADLQLDSNRWSLLGADESAVLELAAVLGVRYRRESPTEISHTNMIFVLSPTGEVVGRLEPGFESDRALAAIRTALD